MHVTPLYTAPVATQPSVPAGWKLVPIQPTEDQWGGLARTIMMAWDFNQKTPYELFDFLSRSGHKIPPWMMQENEMRNRDHIPSKGTRATLIYRAFLEAAPTPPAVDQPSIPETPDSSKSVSSAQDREDAERYRYLRTENAKPYEIDGCLAVVYDDEKGGTWVGCDLDAAIDAARSAKEQP